MITHLFSAEPKYGKETEIDIQKKKNIINRKQFINAIQKRYFKSDDYSKMKHVSTKAKCEREAQ